MKILFMSDFSPQGSGYKNISLPLCLELKKLGHEIKAVGIMYDGSEHEFDLSIIPASNPQVAFQLSLFLKQAWEYDVLVVALDLPLQKAMYTQILQSGIGYIPYIGIMPIEADPLIMADAMFLSQLNKVFIISEFGTALAKEKNLDAEYLEVALDLDAWPQRTEEMKHSVRPALGYTDDDFVVLTVADNQERKNWSSAFKAFSTFAETHPNAKYVGVTRKNLPVGWNLDDMAMEFGFIDKWMAIERGISHKELWMLYAASDVLLLPSKAEGAGLPILEAMAAGVPVIGTNCSAIKDHLSDGRGYLASWEYRYRDPFGNQYRYFADPKDIVFWLEHIYDKGDQEEIDKTVESARKYVESRNWKTEADKVHKALVEIVEKQQ